MDFGTEPPAYTARTRLIRIADAALEQIRADAARALARYGADRVGLCVGSCDNGSEGSRLAHEAFFSSPGAFPSDYALRFQSAGYLAEVIARKFGIAGPAITLSTACASSASAIVKAAELIQAGLCDAAIAGGADVASATVLLGFNALEAASDAVTNPFSKNRKGITLGEGAAFFVLSKGEGGRGAGKIALLGAGESADACHLTAPSSDGSGAIRAMRRALAQAELQPDAVDYLNLHGTGTILNDRMEATAVAAVFPDYERRPAASSTKPITGHTLGAAGALELALCWMMLAASGGSAAPVHCWDGVRDDELPRLAFADSSADIEGLRICMSNSFAFGGCNVSLILGRNDA
jgi:3-oxoacyl-[acyl-carrier-protein] synthase-1